MANKMIVWSPSPIASVHPHAGTIRPGKNEYELGMGQRLINEGLVVPYENQDQRDGASERELVDKLSEGTKEEVSEELPEEVKEEPIGDKQEEKSHRFTKSFKKRKKQKEDDKW